MYPEYDHNKKWYILSMTITVVMRPLRMITISISSTAPMAAISMVSQIGDKYRGIW